MAEEGTSSVKEEEEEFLKDINKAEDAAAISLKVSPKPEISAAHPPEKAAGGEVSFVPASGSSASADPSPQAADTKAEAVQPQHDAVSNNVDEIEDEEDSQEDEEEEEEEDDDDVSDDSESDEDEEECGDLGYDIGHGDEEYLLRKDSLQEDEEILLDVKKEDDEKVNGVGSCMEIACIEHLTPKTVVDVDEKNDVSGVDLKQETSSMDGPSSLILFDPMMFDGNDSGLEEDQVAFVKELENFFKERSLEFKPPKFYGENLNCLKLWRAVTRLGGYDRVTTNKLWRQVGESFKPPKTCTTVSWSFRIFYEKALLDYERHKTCGGELPGPVPALPDASTPADNQHSGNQAPGSGRARRDAAARAMQGWHSQRLLGNGEVADPIIKDRSSSSLQKREKQLKSLGVLKRKKATNLERVVKSARPKVAKTQEETLVVDIGPGAEWVKVNVRRTKDCFEVYALVPGLLREEVRVQSDPAGRIVITGEPEQLDNPWGLTPFRKVVTLPSRIDPNQTSAVVTLHGQLFVRVPFEQSA